MNINSKKPSSGEKPVLLNRLTVILAILLFVPVGFNGSLALANGTWLVETVDDTDSAGHYSSLGLDSTNRPHICYKITPGGHLKYAYYDGSSWNLQIADWASDVGNYISLDIASNDMPYVSYFDNVNADLKCAYKISNIVWGIWRVDEYGWVGMNSSIALDGNDNIHISYEAQMPSGHDYVKYAYYDGVSWNTDIVEEVVTNGTSIAVDSNNLPHIIYNDYDNSILRYAFYDGISWHIETAATGVGSSLSIALDNSDDVHISFYKNLSLYYAYYDGSWNAEEVDSVGQVGTYNDIALDSDGYPHISYHDESNSDLKYAFYDGMAWHIETVDTIESVGEYTSIDLDDSDLPHISYFDYTNMDLKYAHKYFEEIPTFYPTDDAFVSLEEPDANWGSGSTLSVRNRYGAFGSDTWERDTLVKFDLSSIPPGSTISSATLHLYYFDCSFSNCDGRELNCRRVTSSWDEDTVTWNTRPGVAPAVTDQATVPSAFDWMDWDVTSDVQAIVNGEEDNEGWQISDEVTWGTYDIPDERFRSKEYGDYVPYLEIVYECGPPVPSLSGWGVMALGLLLLVIGASRMRGTARND